MAATKTGTHRLTLKTSLAKAVELIASDYLKEPDKKPVRWYFKLDPEAAKILLAIVSKDANLGWKVLRACEGLTLFGSQIPVAYHGYCLNDEQTFIRLVTTRNQELIRWVDKNKKLRGSQ